MFQIEPAEINSEVQHAYQEFFREQVHYLLSQGYQLCRPTLQSSQEEEEISDFLCRGIQQFIEAFSSPDWCCWYCIRNEQPESDNKETGKRRKRKDIVFEFTDTKPRLWYIFEAKRLSTKHGSNQYFKEGLNRFVKEQYARLYPEAGMLGYVQDGTVPHWKAELMEWLNIHAPELSHVSTQSTDIVITDFPSEWSSQHSRISGSLITIFHVLIDCC